MLLEATIIAIGIQLTCLTQNIYFEARNQPTVGQMAVASVVLNRVYDSRYPNTICGVVTQGPTYSWKKDFPVRHRCQFSWYCDGKSDTPTEQRAWNHAITVAKEVYYTYSLGVFNMIDGATHYHTLEVDPDWHNYLEEVAVINNHVFYR